MYSVSFDVFKNKELIWKERQTACYAQLFSHIDSPLRKGVDTIHAYFGLDVNKDNKEVVNRWLQDFVLPRIPDRIKDSFSFEELKDSSCCPPWNPWITLKVDLRTICAYDLYVLLVCFRYPQETMESVVDMFSYNNPNLDEAFVNSHDKLECGWGHALLPYDLMYKSNGRFPNYSFKKVWTDVPEHINGRRVPFTTSCKKTNNVTAYLSPFINQIPKVEEKEEDD